MGMRFLDSSRASFTALGDTPNLGTPTNSRNPEFAELKKRLEELAQNPFERRSFVYLDIISWLESKVDSKTVEAVSRKKFLGRALHDVRVAAILRG